MRSDTVRSEAGGIRGVMAAELSNGLEDAAAPTEGEGDAIEAEQDGKQNERAGAGGWAALRNVHGEVIDVDGEGASGIEGRAGPAGGISAGKYQSGSFGEGPAYSERDPDHDAWQCGGQEDFPQNGVLGEPKGGRAGAQGAGQFPEGRECRAHDDGQDHAGQREAPGNDGKTKAQKLAKKGHAKKPEENGRDAGE